MFASRLNKKAHSYCSWKPDPSAVYVNAFSVIFPESYFYAFPPFSMILKCLEKITRERASGVILVPLWPTQVWFPKLVSMLTAVPLVSSGFLGNDFQERFEASVTQKPENGSLLCFRERFALQGFSKRTTDIMCASWTKGTKDQYQY